MKLAVVKPGQLTAGLASCDGGPGSVLRVPGRARRPARWHVRIMPRARLTMMLNYLMMRPARAARFRHVISACDRSYRAHARCCVVWCGRQAHRFLLLIRRDRICQLPRTRDH